MIRLIDISVPITQDMVSWPGLAPTCISRSLRMEDGDAVNVTDCSFCAHTGTHVDSPFHHFANGVGMEHVPLDSLVGKALVVDLTGLSTPGVQASDLRAVEHLPTAEIVLLKTRNSTDKRFWEGWREDYVYLEPEGAEYLRSLGVKAVGIDTLGIEQFGREDGATHKALLCDSEVAIIEGLDLRQVRAGFYLLLCLPLKLVGADGAPARAVLLDDPSGAFLASWDALRKENP